MRLLVTGAAGFIGSHIVDRLVTDGHEVWGIDSFIDYYDRRTKQRNVDLASGAGAWHFEDRTISSLGASDLEGVDVVMHLAAQPGVRASWDDIATYTELNLNETSRLAGAVVAAEVPRVVFASSSSVYGNTTTYPTQETSAQSPRSPYGVTKQAGEAIWQAFAHSAPLAVLALRLFTVYGPGQRPDMATQRLVRAALTGEQFTLFGDGSQRRDFTFVDDVADAFARASTAPVSAGLHQVNIGGAGDTSMNELVALVERTTNRPIDVHRVVSQRGDVLRTGADVERARQLLSWTPTTALAQGVARQVAFEEQPTRGNWTTTRAK